MSNRQGRAAAKRTLAYCEGASSLRAKIVAGSGGRPASGGGASVGEAERVLFVFVFAIAIRRGSRVSDRSEAQPGVARSAQRNRPVGGYMRSRSRSVDYHDADTRRQSDEYWDRQFALVRARSDAYRYGLDCKAEGGWKPRDAFALYPDSSSPDASTLRRLWSAGCFGQPYVDPELPENWRELNR